MTNQLTKPQVNDIAEIVAEIWRSGKDNSQVFDFHECSVRERWVARLVSLQNQAVRETLKMVEDIIKEEALKWEAGTDGRWGVANNIRRKVSGLNQLAGEK